MIKKKCLLHANCQGEPIEDLLMLSPEFSSEYAIHRFTNYIREPIPDQTISNCDLFLFQHLKESWGELGSEFLRTKLKKSARAIAFPAMFFQTYWPLWGNLPGKDYADVFLESLLEKDLTEAQVLHLYMNTRITRIYDLERAIRISEQHEREKEAFNDIKHVDLIQSQFKARRLFNTVNHPRKELLIYTANAILEQLNMPPLPEDAVAGFPEPFPEFELPIHPQIAEYLGLEFGTAGDRYHVYGAALTFEEYAVRYIKCRRNNIDDFIGFLQAAARMNT